MPVGPKRVELFAGPLDGAVIDAPGAAYTMIAVGMQEIEFKATGKCYAPEIKRQYPCAVYQLRDRRWVHRKTMLRPE